MQIQLNNFPDTERNILQPIINQINSKTKDDSKYLFLWINNDKESNRELLRRTVNTEENVVLFTKDTNLAIVAWQANLAGFMLWPCTEKDLLVLVNRLSTQNIQSPFANKFSLREQDGVHQYDGNNILLIEAMGHYSRIYFTNGRNKVCSVSLKRLEEMLGSIVYMKRLHMSYILNIKLINSIRGTSIYFNGETEEKPFSFQERFCYKVKKYILWQGEE